MQLKFELSVEQANVILSVLAEAPYRIAAPVIATLQAQAQPQMQPQLVPEPQAETKSDAERP